MGRNKLNKILILDIEAAAWENEDGTKTPPPGMRPDIIEIGACLLDTTTGKISQKTSYIIKPRNATLSPFIIELTTITQEQVNRGIPFGDACNKLAKEFSPRNKVWAAWGDYDRIHIQNECEFYGAQYPLGRTFINSKTLFSLVNGFNKEMGLRAAMDYYDLDFKGTQHRGHDDAFNTAKVLWKTLKR